jgi:methyl acetate hydrolase
MTVLSSIDKILRGATEAGDLPGVVALVATREGAAYQGAAGKRVLPTGPDMTVDSVFWIASMTKAVTSTAAMQLVERGKLQLDQPISEVLPELASPRVLEGFDAAGEPKLRLATRPITLRHLLTHLGTFQETRGRVGMSAVGFAVSCAKCGFPALRPEVKVIGRSGRI